MDFYELINNTISPQTLKIKHSDFTDAAYNQLTDEQEKKAFSLLKTIAAMSVHYENDKVLFKPAYAIENEKRRDILLQDLSDKDFELLYSIELDKLPLILGLRVADALWVGKTDYKMAQKSIELSFEIYTSFINNDNWCSLFDFISHSVCLAAKINSKTIKNYLDVVYNQIINLNGSDSGFFSLKLIELLLSQKWSNYDDIINVLDAIISNSANNIHKVKKAYELKTNIYNKQLDTQSAMTNNGKLANYFEKSGDDELERNIFMAIRYYEDAIHLYRNNGLPKEGERVHIKLVAIQNKLPKLMIPIYSKVTEMQSYEDVKEFISGRSNSEKIVRLILLTKMFSFKKADLKQEVLNIAKDDISLSLFGTGALSDKGQTIINIPPHDTQNPEADQALLELPIHLLAYKKEKIIGDTILKWAMEILASEELPSLDDIKFITKDNPIIPTGRENIFLNGLYYGLTGKLYTSLHILLPQMENLFRNIAKYAGGNVNTFKDDNTSESKLLTSVFDMPELLDCYDNDILFMFKGMMNEKAGGNLRNKIAHGIMSENEGNSGIARFFYCWVLTLLSFTSKEYYVLKKKSDNEFHSEIQTQG